jgi:hypothetical protein
MGNERQLFGCHVIGTDPLYIAPPPSGAYDTVFKTAVISRICRYFSSIFGRLRQISRQS